MDDIIVERELGDGYRKCEAKTIKPDEFGNDVKLYVNSHFYHGHSNMKIEHMRLIHTTIGEFLKKYDKALDEEEFPMSEV